MRARRFRTRGFEALVRGLGAGLVGTAVMTGAQIAWGYGVSLGTAFSLVARKPRSHPLRRGVGFGLGAWAAAYAELVSLGIYKPPWCYDAQTLATEASYHVTYGVAVAGAAAVLAR